MGVYVVFRQGSVSFGVAVCINKCLCSAYTKIHIANAVPTPLDLKRVCVV